MDRLSRIVLVSGIAVMFLGVALSVFDIAERATPIVVAWAASLLFLAFFRTYLSKKGEAYKDERTQKVQFTAMAASWWITFVSLASMYVLSASELVQISVEHLIQVIILIMALSFVVALTYISRRGT